MRALRAASLALLPLLAACADASDEVPGFSPEPTTPQAATAGLAAVPVTSADMVALRLGRKGPKTPGIPRVLFLGDSFTCGFGLARGEPAWPELLAQELAEEHIEIEVLNAGVVGDTSFGGLRRLPALAPLQPDLIVIELGGNDYIAGLSLDGIREDLRGIVEAGRAMGARVVLSGLSLPPALLGTTRGREFVELYPALAAELQVDLLPDLLEDVMDSPRFLQADGLHPTAEGHKVMAHNALAPMRSVLAAPPGG